MFVSTGISKTRKQIYNQNMKVEIDIESLRILVRIARESHLVVLDKQLEALVRGERERVSFV